MAAFLSSTGGSRSPCMVAPPSAPGLKLRPSDRGIVDIPAMVLPAVLIMKTGTALILIGVDPANQSVRVVDPTIQPDTPQVLSIKAVTADYTGYTFLVRAAAEADARAVAAGDLPRNHWFWSTVKVHWRSYGHIALAALLINMLALAMPLFTMSVYDRVVPNGAIPSLIALSVGMGIAVVFDFVLRAVRSRMIDVTGKTMDVVLAANIFEHVHGGQDGAATGIGRNSRQSVARLQLGTRVLYLRQYRVGNRSALRGAVSCGAVYDRGPAGLDSAGHAAGHDCDRLHSAASARSGDETPAG